MIKQTQYIEATSHSNNRTEFTVPKYMCNNFRLIDFGVKTYTPATDRQYPYGCGALCLIDTITVYDGSTIISQSRGVNQFSAFREQCDGASANYSIGSSLYNNSLNYEPNQTIQINQTAPTLGAGKENLTYVDLWKIVPFFLGLDLEAYNQMRQAVKKGNKKQIKKLVKSANVIPCDKLNLRIVIEYSQLSADLLFHNGQESDTYDINRPILCVDKISGAPSSNDFQIVYDNYDLEIIKLNGFDANPGEGTELAEQQLRLYACDGKFLKDITLVNSAISAYEGASSFFSGSQFKESMNIIVNSEKLIPYDLNTPARKQMYLNYSKSNFMTPILSNVYGHGATEDNKLYGGPNDNASLMTKLNSYLTLTVDQRINQLVLQYQRSTYTNDFQFEPIMMNCFYTTQRTLNYKNGQMVIAY